MYAVHPNLRLTHHSKIQLAAAQGGRLNAVIGAGIRLAKIQVVDRGGERCGGACKSAAVNDCRSGICWWSQIQVRCGHIPLTDDRPTDRRYGSRRFDGGGRRAPPAGGRGSDGRTKQAEGAHTRGNTYQAVLVFLLHGAKSTRILGPRARKTCAVSEREDENRSGNARDLHEESPLAILNAHWSTTESVCRDATARNVVSHGGKFPRANSSLRVAPYRRAVVLRLW